MASHEAEGFSKIGGGASQGGEGAHDGKVKAAGINLAYIGEVPGQAKVSENGAFEGFDIRRPPAKEP